MKKLISLILGIAFIYSCSTSNDGNGNTSTPVTDVDGNTYQTVVICNQTWTKTNLNVSKYRNGDVIPQVTDPVQWASLSTGAWCYYNNDPANGATYGKIYNNYAVIDPRGIAPVGYHIPTLEEWVLMLNCLDPNSAGGNAPYDNAAGGAMKETGHTHWSSLNQGATNSSGFTGLPGGQRETNGTFSGINNIGIWWGIGDPTITYNFNFIFYISNHTASAFRSTRLRSYGLSVRCIKD